MMHVQQMQLPLSLEERDQLDVLEEVIDNGLQTFVDVGNALMEIRDGRLYREAFGTFEDYCRERWGFTQQSATRYIRASQTVQNLQSEPMGSLPTSERQARPLTRLEPEQQREAWQRAVETAPEGKVTAKHVAQVAQEFAPRGVANLDTPLSVQGVSVMDTQPEPQPRPHVSHNSGNNEWYTPEEYINAARATMGEIDLDPASSLIANEVVQAKAIFTADDDGLAQEWRGRVWMNPPYSSDLVGRFAEKMVDSFVDGTVTEAVVLVNNATETAWFQQLACEASAICLPARRVRFWKPSGDTGAPLQGQAILYLGNNVDRFGEEFQHMGIICLVHGIFGNY